MGFVLGITTLTGMGFKFSAFVLDLSGTAAQALVAFDPFQWFQLKPATLFFGLIFTALACIIMGTGVPTTPTYINTPALRFVNFTWGEFRCPDLYGGRDPRPGCRLHRPGSTADRLRGVHRAERALDCAGVRATPRVRHRRRRCADNPALARPHDEHPKAAASRRPCPAGIKESGEATFP